MEGTISLVRNNRKQHVMSKGKIRSMPNVSMMFITGSKNYRLSIKDHDSSACHQRAIREKEHAEAIAAGT